MDRPNASGPADSGEEHQLPDFPPLFPPEAVSPSPARQALEIKIGTATVAFDLAGKSTSVEVFTMTLGNETIELLPQKTWMQLDRHKWSAQGKLPAAPSGLEIGLDQVHFAGQTLSPRDLEARAKLERLLNDWLTLETELTRKKASTQLPVTAPPPPPQPDPTALRFSVELDKRSQVHVHCIQNKQTLASIGLTAAGFNSLIQQGFMRKPRELHIGVLHDWVELDGDLFSFENGKNDGLRLEQILNERYLPSETSTDGKEVLVLVNAASATGFDIQFPATVGGVPGIHRQHLDEQALELLQDKQRCGLLHKEIIIKVIAPNFIFKRRTAEGGEQYLARHPDNIVIFTNEDGRETKIDLSQPVDFLHITAPELTAVFNHSSVSRRSKSSPPPVSFPQPSATAVLRASSPQPSPPKEEREKAPVQGPNAHSGNVEAQCEPREGRKNAPSPPPPDSRCRAVEAGDEGEKNSASAVPERMPITTPTSLENEAQHSSVAAASAASGGTVEKRTVTPKVLPNLWLKELLSKAPVRHEWLAPLAYRKLARHFENSSEGTFGQTPCWFISLNGESDLAAPAFNGIFLTEKGGLGFLSKGQIARFNNGVGFIGKVEAPHEVIGINLVATGLNARSRIAFILADNYRSKFELPEKMLAQLFKELNEKGAAIMSISELLADQERIDVIWTLPAEQTDPNNPQVVELRPPAS